MEETLELRQKPPLYTLKAIYRFLIAFAIGLPTTMIFPFIALPTPVWWQLGTPLTVLLLAMLVAIIRDPVVLEGRLDTKQIRNNMITAVLLILAYFIFEVVMWNTGGLSGITSLIALPFIPLMTGLVCSFTLAGGRSKGFGIFCGIFGWLGAATVNTIATVFDAREMTGSPELLQQLPGYTEGNVIGAALMISFLIHMTGLAIAALGGEFGWRLRRKLLTQDSVREAPGFFVRKAAD